MIFQCITNGLDRQQMLYPQLESNIFLKFITVYAVSLCSVQFRIILHFNYSVQGFGMIKI